MKLDLDIFQIKSNDLSPEKGRALIAEPILPDIIFSRSVIFLVDDADNKHTGLILNKESGVTVGSVINAFEGKDFPLFLGGPVDTETVHFLHTYGKIIPNAIHIKGNVYWGGDFDAVVEMLDANVLDQNKISFFLGYSGWTEGQLSEELENDSWLVCNVPDSFVFSDPKHLWKYSLTYVDKKYEIWKNFPENPELN
ncbi:MAG: YqgE/AlgH family protein [Bacteroidota bacterium]|nr:YqgE/AlgH family protein [Bacteroidota bacterium]